MGKLDNRVALVTGAGRNVGEEIAHGMAAEGARVAVVDIVGERAQRVADAINMDRPGTALAIQADVTLSADVQRMIGEVVARWGGLQILVNNVGVVDRKGILEADEADWDRIIAISLKSVFLCSKYAAQQMVAAGQGGRIVNIASTSGHRARLDAVAYPAAKGGVLHLTRCLATQLGPYGIRVNSVTPNRVLTSVEAGEVPRNWTVRNLIGRQVTPQDVAHAVIFLTSDAGDAITGTDLLVDGGSLQLVAGA